jgi:hypothetical protein
MSLATQSVIFFRVYREVALVLYTNLVEDLCSSPSLPYQLATTLEDIGQGFMKLAERVNGELERRGLLEYEAEAEETIEAKIEAFLAGLFVAHRDPVSDTPVEVADAGLNWALVEQALKIALTMTHDLPIAQPS